MTIVAVLGYDPAFLRRSGGDRLRPWALMAEGGPAAGAPLLQVAIHFSRSQ